MYNKHINKIKNTETKINTTDVRCNATILPGVKRGTKLID